jgi:hypothetical protein
MAEQREGIGILPGLVGMLAASLVGATAMSAGLSAIASGGQFFIGQFIGIILIIAFFAFAYGLTFGLPLVMVLQSKGRYSLVTSALAGVVVIICMLTVLWAVGRGQSPWLPFATNPLGQIAILSLAGALAGATFFVVQQRVRHGCGRHTDVRR